MSEGVRVPQSITTDATTMAVVAHGLLGSLSVIGGAAATLQRNWERLDEQQRANLFEMIRSQTDHVSGVLGDLARGLSPEIQQALSELRPAPRAEV